MKYVIVQGDGMADNPLEELSGRTPLEAANTPNMDEVASAGELGAVNTIPSSLPPGSSVGNMSLMGLDPEEYFSGRASLEARGQGVPVKDDDVVFRCNLVRLGANGERKIMEDYSGGHPSPEVAEQYVNLLDEEIDRNGFKFYSGVSYRNLLVWKNGRKEVDLGDISLTPAHDITGEPARKYIPRGAGAEKLKGIQEKAGEVLKNEGKSFNGVWLWGAGVKPDLPSFQERYELTGAVISAVDLIKGLGAYTGLSPIEVKGATGSIDTDYEGKVRAVKENLKEGSLVFLHIEAPDEASHAGDLGLKTKAIERIDERVIEPLVNYLSGRDDSRLLLVTDHVTGIESKTHERGRVPFAITGFGRSEVSPGRKFAEREASRSGEVLESGADLIDLFIRGEES
ncbi:cofactor-independent phosphoglycerate mutase [Candidatus Bipolaricaulota bacterium]|nr:cofactor-independent phosphoglycerate mutase [Candidatus Bipolaricaulota bacterium]